VRGKRERRAFRRHPFLRQDRLAGVARFSDMKTKSKVKAGLNPQPLPPRKLPIVVGI
jgi:hypothetical protein